MENTMFKVKYVFGFIAFLFVVGLPAQEVIPWGQADLPPLFRSGDVALDEKTDFIARRQFLEEVYGRLRVPRFLNTQKFKVSIAALVTFRATGKLSIDRLFLVNADAENYQLPNDDDPLVGIAYGSSHPDLSLIDSIRTNKSLRIKRELIIAREALLIVPKKWSVAQKDIVLEAIRLASDLPPFKPATIDGRKVATFYSFPVVFRHQRGGF